MQILSIHHQIRPPMSRHFKSRFHLRHSTTSPNVPSLQKRISSASFHHIPQCPVTSKADSIRVVPPYPPMSRHFKSRFHLRRCTTSPNVTSIIIGFHPQKPMKAAALHPAIINLQNKLFKLILVQNQLDFYSETS